MLLHVRERAELRPSVSFDPPALPSPSKPRIGLTPDSDCGFQVSRCRFEVCLLPHHRLEEEPVRQRRVLAGGTCVSMTGLAQKRAHSTRSAKSGARTLVR